MWSVPPKFKHKDRKYTSTVWATTQSSKSQSHLNGPQVVSLSERREAARRTTNRQTVDGTKRSGVRDDLPGENQVMEVASSCLLGLLGLQVLDGHHWPGSEVEAEVRIVAEWDTQQVRVSRPDCCGAEWQVWALVLLKVGGASNRWVGTLTDDRGPNSPITISLNVQTEEKCYISRSFVDHVQKCLYYKLIKSKILAYKSSFFDKYNNFILPGKSNWD